MEGSLGGISLMGSWEIICDSSSDLPLPLGPSKSSGDCDLCSTCASARKRLDCCVGTKMKASRSASSGSFLV